MVDLSALLASSSSSASSRSSIGGSGVSAGQHRSVGGAGPAAVDVGLKLPGVTGPVWGLHMKVRFCRLHALCLGSSFQTGE
jgi:hypothetical protein